MSSHHPHPHHPRLLVSVRDAAEARAALEGGADVIDAKEPASGALGAVAPETLAGIVAALPPGTPCSVALGDAATVDDARRAARLLHALDDLPSAAPIAVKLACHGLADAATWARVVAALVAELPACHVVAVRYADAGSGDAPAASDLLAASADGGARGVLVDTRLKDGTGLFDHWDAEGCRRWIDAARERGLSVALAGSLAGASLARAATLGPDLVGVRGAAAEGGRAGRVTAGRVREARLRLVFGPAVPSPAVVL
ncbi:MAG: (5-formylfuran-3-yl)methyl phosphate synthase [Gemmatimonadales bacterium]|nr:(5-formylfuran-3-yl)methyl phosphate synthase [Gemmatimonadales bacterium]